MKRWQCLAYISILLTLVFCNVKHSALKDEIPLVSVSVLPQHYFVKRIAGETVKINVMIPPGHNPRTYEPGPQQIKALANSKMYFRIGHIAFEKAWMKRLTEINPGMVVVDTSAGVQLIEKVVVNGRAHPHGGIDPHIWLSPSAVKVQSKHILEGLCRIQPENRKIYRKNLDYLIKDIENLDQSIRGKLESIKTKKILAYHPAWGYLAREYGLTQLAIEAEGKEPNPAQLKELIQTARKENIKVIIVQKQFDTHNARTIAREIDGRIITLDPLSPYWLQNMKTITQTIIGILKNE